jgi:hypothetical protein
MNDNDTSSHTSDRSHDGKTHIAKVSMLTCLLVSALALAVAAVHLIWPRLKVDGITVTLLVIALLPWLGTVFESLELPGGWKVQYRKIRQQLNETQAKTQQATGAAASASQKAELALATNEPGSHPSHPRTTQQLDELVDRYNEARSSQPSGYPRTTIMTQIVGRMVRLSQGLSNYDWTDALRSENQGRRMAGYAWLYARPDPAAAELLVQTLTTRENTNFGQYWAIQALQKCLPLTDIRTEAALKPELKTFLSKLPSDSDRHYELSKLLTPAAGQPQH